MKAQLYSLDGKQVKQVDLPNQFSEEYRADLIKRAVLSEESKLRQAKGSYKFAGMETSAKYRGVKDAYASLKNRGQAMLPREVRPKGQMGTVKKIPSAVKGRRAHPPKPQKVFIERMNKKEYKKALRSALSSTTIADLVSQRCKTQVKAFPLVVEDSFEKLQKAKEVVAFLEKVKLNDLVTLAKKRTRRKSGVRRTRSKSIKKSPKYLLIVTGDSAKSKVTAISGVDIVKVSDLKVKDLAPGTLAGRVTIYTESALKQIGEKL